MVELLDRVGVIPERVDIGGGLFGKMADSLKAQFTSEREKEIFLEILDGLKSSR